MENDFFCPVYNCVHFDLLHWVRGYDGSAGLYLCHHDDLLDVLRFPVSIILHVWIKPDDAERGSSQRCIQQRLVRLLRQRQDLDQDDHHASTATHADHSGQIWDCILAAICIHDEDVIFLFGSSEATPRRVEIYTSYTKNSVYYN